MWTNAGLQSWEGQADAASGNHAVQGRLEQAGAWPTARGRAGTNASALHPSNFPKICTLPHRSFTSIVMPEDRAPDRDPSCEQNAPKHGGWVEGSALAGWVQNFFPSRHFEHRNATVGERF